MIRKKSPRYTLRECFCFRGEEEKGDTNREPGKILNIAKCHNNLIWQRRGQVRDDYGITNDDHFLLRACSVLGSKNSDIRI